MTYTPILLAGTFTPLGSGDSTNTALAGIWVPDPNYPNQPIFTGVLDFSLVRTLNVTVNTANPVGGTSPTLAVFVDQMDLLLPASAAKKNHLFGFTAVTGISSTPLSVGPGTSNNLALGLRGSIAWNFGGTVAATSWPFYISVIGKD